MTGRGTNTAGGSKISAWELRFFVHQLTGQIGHGGQNGHGGHGTSSSAPAGGTGGSATRNPRFAGATATRSAPAPS